jgi:copper/silver efflux system protein
MGFFIRGKILAEHRNPINRFLIWVYHPVLEFALRFRYLLLAVAILTVGVTVLPYQRLGSEFMPPLWEGDLLYMPTTLPGVSITEARQILQQTDKIIKTFPEVEHVFGKVGRADTATDPAPLSMIETTITLKPESQWPAGMTVDELKDEMNAAMQIPGVTNAWTMPIKTRIDMLSTGIKTPVGIKLAGPDLNVLQQLGKQVEGVMRDVPGTLSVYAERVMGGNYLDFSIDRDAIARYGLTVGDVQDVIQSGIGGMDITTTVEGLERYPVNLRYNRDFRDNLPALMQVLIPTPTGQQIPVGQLASARYVLGPPAIKTEGARPNAWIYVDLRGIDVGTYVSNAQKILAGKVKLPAGYTLTWSGQYEYMQRAQQRLMYVVPLTIVIIFVILFLNTKSLMKTAIVFLAIPFSLVGAIWLVYLLHYNMSVAVWVGIIALAGLSAETGVVMLLYLDQAYEDFRARGILNNRNDLADAIYEGAVRRVRPKVMTICVIIAGLLPILWSNGAGADVMKRIATPMVGGIVTSGIMELALFPIIFYLWRSWRLPKGGPFTGFHHLKDAR